MGRHSTPRLVAGRGVAVPIATVLALSTGAAVNYRAHQAAPERPRLAGCSAVERVSIAAPPELTPVLSATIDRLESTACIDYQLTAETAATTARTIARNATEQPMLWVSDSPAWIDAATTARPAAGLRAQPSVATSPVGVLVPPAVTDAPIGAVSACALAEGLDSRLRLLDPQTSTASVLFLAGLAVKADDSAGDCPGAIDLLLRHADRLSSAGDLAPGLLGGDGLAFPASEQQMYAAQGQAPDQRPTAVFVGPAAPRLDYRLTAVSGPGGRATERAVRAVQDALTSAAGRDELIDAGFRVGDETASDIDGFMGSAPPALKVTPAVTL